MAKVKVTVLMSTFNGEKYVTSQIDSILQQNDVEVELIIRDDGSTDDTNCRLQEYGNKCSNITIIRGQNRGFVDSFSELVTIAYDNSDSNYYAFVDQDDIWYPNKLQIACRELSVFSDDTPNLFCSNSDIIDEKGIKTGKLFRMYRPHYTRGNVLLFSTFQGCSMVFNRKALELYNNHQPQIAFHDRWMYLICHFLGHVYYNDSPLFGYRIHESNALGVKKQYSLKENIQKLCDMLFTKNNSGYFPMNKEFFEQFGHFFKEDDRRLANDYLNYKSHFRSKLILLLSPKFGPAMPSLREKVIYYPHILLNKL